jgi:predicted metal-dependent hydrolase
MAKQFETATLEGIREKGLRKRLGNRVEEYLNIMGIKNKQVMVRDLRKWRNIHWESRCVIDCSS